MLQLNRRDCKLGLKATTDGKELDGEEIKTLTLELSEVMLDKNELNALLAEPHAWDVLYNGADPAEPYLKCLKHLELKAPAEHAHVTLHFGLQRRKMAFSDCKLSKITLALTSGGATALSCKVTATPVLDESLAALFEHLGQPIECVIRAELPNQQQDLPLNRFTAETPAPEPDDGEDDEAETTADPKPKKRKPKTLRRAPRKRSNGDAHP